MFNSLIAIVMFIITTILFHVLYGIKGKNISGKSSKKFTVRSVFYVTIVILGSRVISNDLVVFILTPFSKMLMTKSMLEALNEVVQVPFLAYVYITGPAMEELVFRGVILGGLLKTYSVKKSIIISSILFGVVHLNGIQFINAFLLGILIGYIYVKTKSMYLCMYFHILFNTIDVIFIYLPEIQNLLLSIPFTILGVLFIIYGLKKINGFKIDIC
ncbi:CPBP family intramembrane glutamic endopeptidase [Clostridium kluyveri]|uniref:CPBP family intramembrane glutamic endopeptidase n=1 Tax=Clostridium kluyveri TaxID=1534 RepID=UPI0022466C36|nr:type II CAAX endopeptidase family protein [Clostridium kluyveri]UZQ49154.1 CPBP family intramembrane metalloprotease [Clostridium kluyveri]